MSNRDWRWISASVRGTSHLKSGTECQDRHICTQFQSRDGSILLLIVSDGAGSAKRSASGAQLLCETLRDQIVGYFDEQGKVTEINSRLVAHWIEAFRSEVILLAEGEGLTEREFACTLIGAVVGSHSAAFFQVGDGAVVFSSDPGGPYTLAFWPERGEYENTTYFATQSTFIEQLQFLSVETALSEIGLLSDGLQRLALNYQTQQPHSPFFCGLFPALRSTSGADLPLLNDRLSTYLNSPKLNERTDDDKTLVLAVAE